MSNYVRNYVFCSENLYNNFQEKDFDDRLFKSSMYEPEGMKIDDDKYFIVFDTRGMEYKEDLIRAIIYEYRDTIWYCIEENNIEQGFFWFDKNKVLRTSRQLSQACADCILNLQYTDNYFRPFMDVFVFREQIVIEEYMHNRKVCIPLCKTSYEKMKAFEWDKLGEIVSVDQELKTYTLSTEDEVWKSCWIWGCAHDKNILIEIGEVELYQEGDPEVGEVLLSEIERLIEEVCLDNDGYINLDYNRLRDFL